MTFGNSAVHSNTSIASIDTEMFVINCKNYAQATARRLDVLVRAAEDASKKYGTRIAIAPPTHLISSVKSSRVLLFAQHVDDSDAGPTTGYIIPELLKSSKVSGAIINHSEHRIPFAQIGSTIKRLRKLGMTSIACSRNVPETIRIASLNPDYVAIEPPSLIGSGISISRARPELVTRAADALKGKRTRLLCGAGIVTGDDVTKALELGSEGILVASGIVKSASPRGAITKFASSFNSS